MAALAPVFRGLLARLFLALMLPLVACGSKPQGPEIDLSARPEKGEIPLVSPAPRPDLVAGGELVLAVAAVNSPRSTFDAYKALADYLGAKLGVNARLVVNRTYAEINSLVRSGDATLAIVCTLAYVLGHEEFGMEALVVPVVRGEPVYYSYLIVHKESTVTSWEELRGRTFAFTDPMSNSGHLVPVYQLWQKGETPASYFSRYIFTYSHDNSIKAVGNRLVDAASVDSLVYDYALAKGEDDAVNTKVIWRSPPYGINPVVVNPALAPDFKGKLKELLLGMDKDTEGRRILDQLQFDGFIPARDAAYESVREMNRATIGRSRGGAP